MVSNYLNNGTLKICRNCDHLIKEFQSYVWDAKSQKTGIDKPLKENDHCLAGDTIILTDEGYARIDSIIGKSGKIASSKENRFYFTDYKNVRKTREKQTVYELLLEDGTKIKSTSDHLFLTHNGWKRLDCLMHSDMVYTWNTSSFKI
jgi:hypothetical protein